jgi:glutamine---fructose-6-phosphate transaminase (isomerizing)
MATINKRGELQISKYASLNTTSDSIDRLKENSAQHVGTSIGIAHTRWATHGGRTDENAHPHNDFGNRVAVVHNGTINNSYDLKQDLISKGIKFSSETDTEVIAHLIGEQLDKGHSTKDAVARALANCDGSWGLAVVNKNNPDEIVVACNGSPMVIGIANGRTYIASETSAFSRYTKNFISLKDGEIGVVGSKSTSMDISRVEVAPDHEVLLSPHPYAHFTMKECREQPESIARAMSYGARMSDDRIHLGGLDMNKKKMSEIHNMVLTACGTSKYASELGAKIMRDLDCFDTVSVIDSAEVRRCDIPHKQGGVLAVSQSGETKDVVRAVKIAQEENVTVMSVVNTVGALIPRLTGLGVYLNAGREHAVASTKAFTSQVTVLTLIALWFRQMREELNPGLHVSAHGKEYKDALQRLPISFGMAFRLHDKCKEIAKELNSSHSLFVLGKGYGEPIAMEGALKLKEIGYIHAEGCSGGALKHGPFALIEGEL